ncbi:hypothetical protein V6Z12_D05G226000 [Gossypium hirsutum]
MANPKDPKEWSFSFSDFPEDVQLCILSFLSLPDIANFACTSKRSVSLCCNDTKLWFALCQRRWGPKTQINKWGGGQITYKLLYKTLTQWENLIGFWRHCGRAGLSGQCPRLIIFEWGPSFVFGSRVCPSKNGTYHVTKSPFLWMGISPDGQIVYFLDLEGQTEIPSGDFGSWLEFVCMDQNLVPANVNFMVMKLLRAESLGAYRTDLYRKCIRISRIERALVVVGIERGGGKERRRRKGKGGGNGSLSISLKLSIARLLRISPCRVFGREFLVT